MFNRRKFFVSSQPKLPQLTCSPEFHSGGIGIVEMLYRSNILALVGGGRSPRYPTNKVMVWDDAQTRCIGELSFRSEVAGVRLRRDRIVVVLRKTIYVYNFQNLDLLDHIATVNNSLGLCAVSSATHTNVLVCPGREKGQVRVELYDVKKTTIVRAHESELQALACNLDGSLFATASEKGTLVRVFKSHTGDLLHEFRRGAEKAVIYSLAFNSTSTFLACSSDKGTVHVFSLKQAEVANQNILSNAPGAHLMPRPGSSSTDPSPNGETSPSSYLPTGSFKFIKGLLPKYFNSEWSFAQFRVPETKCICAFGAEANTLLVVCADGSFFKAQFGLEPGMECKKKKFKKFLQTENE